MKDVVVQYWRCLTGQNPNKKSWFCWVYVQTKFNFQEWMDKYCPTAECTFRFNSGNPVYIVTISDEQEALLFQLKWDVSEYAYR